MPSKISIHDLVRISQAAYTGQDINTPRSYDVVGSFKFRTEDSDVSLFYNKITDTYVFAFRGTDPNSDLFYNQILTDKKILARESHIESFNGVASYVAKEASRLLAAGHNVAMTGHSFGGVEAAVAASLINSKYEQFTPNILDRFSAVAFDAPFANSDNFYKSKYNISNIINISSTADPVSAFTRAAGNYFPGAVAYVYTGEDPDALVGRMEFGLKAMALSAPTAFLPVPIMGVVGSASLFAIGVYSFKSALGESFDEGHSIDAMAYSIYRMQLVNGGDLYFDDMLKYGEDHSMYDAIVAVDGVSFSTGAVSGALHLLGGLGLGSAGGDIDTGDFVAHYMDRLYSEAFSQFGNAISDTGSATQLTFTSSWGGDVTSSIDWSAPNVESYISPDAV
ncbi:lipase family protein, partial [Xanthobacter agilis]